MDNTFVYNGRHYPILNTEYVPEEEFVFFEVEMKEVGVEELTPDCFPDRKIRFAYKDVQVEATILALIFHHINYIAQGDNIVLGGNPRVRAYVTGIHSLDPAEGRLLFKISHLTVYFFALRATRDFEKSEVHNRDDGWSITLAGRRWMLRHGYRTPSGKIVPLDIYTATQNKAPKEEDKSGDTFLETFLSPSDQLDSVEASADSICLLLGVAKGRRIMWDTLWQVNTDHLLFRKESSRTPSSNKSKIPIIPDSYLYNFLKKAYPAYNEFPQEGKNILYTFTLSEEFSFISITGTHHGILLERMSSAIYQSVFPPVPQIGQQLADCLSDKKAKQQLSSQIEALFAAVEPNWTSSRTNQILDTISSWNKEPSYLGKISMVLERGGFPLKINGQHINQRHKLLHTGNLSIADDMDSRMDFYKNISLYTTLLLLALLDYENLFYAVGRPYEMKTLLPHAHLLRHPNNTGGEVRTDTPS